MPANDDVVIQQIVCIMFVSSILLSGICLTHLCLGNLYVETEYNSSRIKTSNKGYYVCPSDFEDFNLPEKKRNVKNQRVKLAPNGREVEGYCVDISKELSSSFSKILYETEAKAELLKRGALTGFGNVSAQWRLIKGGTQKLKFFSAEKKERQHERGVEVTTSEMTIVQSGFYHVYCSILFRKSKVSENQTFYEEIVRYRPMDNGNETILSANYPSDPPCEFIYTTSYLSGVFRLQRNDSLLVKISHPDLFADGDEENLFFGVMMLRSLEND